MMIFSPIYSVKTGLYFFNPVLIVVFPNIIGLFEMLGQSDTKAGSQSNLTFYLDGTTQLLNDTPGNKKAKSGPFPGGLCAEKRFEYFIQILPGDTSPGIGNGDHTAVAGIFDGNGNGAGGFYGMNGICQQVQKYLPQLVRIALNGAQ